MSAGNRKLKSFAHRLLEHSKTDGIVDSEKVKAVIDTLKKKQPRGLKKALIMYRDAVRDDIRNSTARVQYAGTITESSTKELQQTLETKAGRKLVMELIEDPNLIAGVKVTVGDSVFEHSIQQMLTQLSQSR